MAVPAAQIIVDGGVIHLAVKDVSVIVLTGVSLHVSAHVQHSCNLNHHSRQVDLRDFRLLSAISIRIHQPVGKNENPLRS